VEGEEGEEEGGAGKKKKEDPREVARKAAKAEHLKREFRICLRKVLAELKKDKRYVECRPSLPPPLPPPFPTLKAEHLKRVFRICLRKVLAELETWRGREGGREGAQALFHTFLKREIRICLKKVLAELKKDKRYVACMFSLPLSLPPSLPPSVPPSSICVCDRWAECYTYPSLPPSLPP